MINSHQCPCGGMVDATDLKSVVLSGVGVRVPPRAPAEIPPPQSSESNEAVFIKNLTLVLF